MRTPRELFFSFLLRAWKPFSYILSPLEKGKVASHLDQGKPFGPIFLLGPPRSGSTLTYQLLTENFRLEYIDNLTHALYRTLYTGNRLSHALFNDRGHGSFSSQAGKTIRSGWHAPSECPPYWYLAIPKSKHRVRPQDVPEDLEKRVRDPLLAIMGKAQRPLLIKNLLMIERLEWIKEAFPNAHFLVIERDRLHTALSILKERKALGIDDREWWSARPSNYEGIRELPVEEKVAAQVHYLEADIEEKLSDIPSQRVARLSYGSLIRDPKKELEALERGSLKDLQKRHEHFHLPDIKEKKQLDEAGLHRVKEGFLKLGLPYE